LAVAGEIPSAEAVSSMLSPPKNRHSTTRPCRGCVRSRRRSGLVEREQLVGSLLGKLDRDRVQGIVERQVLDVAASLEAQPVARVVAEDLRHGLGRDCEEMAAALRGDPVAADELQVSFVHDSSSIHRHITVPPTPLAPREPCVAPARRGDEGLALLLRSCESRLEQRRQSVAEGLLGRASPGRTAPADSFYRHGTSPTLAAATNARAGGY
jgi:hypothetical protein